MSDPYTHPDVYAECLAAMLASGDAYPCDTLAPVLQVACALPTGRTPFARQNDHAAVPVNRTEGT